MRRDSFLFYRSFFEAISMLPAEDRLAAYDMIVGYAFGEKEPEEVSISAAIFAMAKPQIDANNKRYEDGKAGAEYGKLGGRPKKETTNKTGKKHIKNPTGVIEENPTGVIEENPTGVKVETPNENENVNDNVNVNENVINKDLHTDILASNACACARPTREEVENYCAEAGIKIDVDAFMDRYQKSDWKIGNSPIRDWRDVAQGWYRIDCKRKQQPAKKNAFLNFSQRDDDLNDLEAQLDRQFANSG